MTPARWAALAVGAPLSLALIGWTGLNAVALIGQGSFTVSTSIPVNDGVLRVMTGGGDITARLAAGSEGQLAGTMHYSLVKPHLYYTSTGLRIECEFPVGDCGLDGTLGVPAGAALDLSTDGGNVTVSGLTTSVTLRTAGGDLTAQDMSGDLQMTSGGGNVTGEGLTDPDVTARTDGGDITLTFTTVPRSLQADTGGGNITVILPHNAAGYALTPTTGGGNVTISPGFDSNSDSPDVVTLNTDGGDITVTEAAAS